MFKIKFIIPVVFLLACNTLVFSQDELPYSVVKQGTIYSSEQIEQAFLTANLCGMINPTESYVIVFDDGTQIKIKAATETRATEQETCVRKENSSETNTVWSISAKGILVRGVKSTNFIKS